MLIAKHWFERGGERLIVVLKRGPKWARVLDPGDLHPRTISTRDLDKYSRAVPVKPRKLATRIDKRRKLYKSLGLFGSKRFTDKPAREAIKLLRESEG